MASNKTIKFGIISDSLIFKLWEAECIKHVLNLKSTSLELLILPSKKSASNNVSLLRRLIGFRIFSRILFYVYQMLFINPKCFSKLDFSEELKNVDKVYWSGNRTNISIKNFSKEDLEKIKRKRLDFIISFSEFTNVSPEILDIPKYGVWAFHHDDEEKYRGNVHCFWEIYHDDNVNGAILKRLTVDKNEYIVIRQGFFKTINYSYKINLESIHSFSIQWLKDVCVDLSNGNEKYLNSLPTESNARFYNEPNNFEFLKFYLTLLKNRFIKAYKDLFLLEQWNIGYIENTFDELLDKNENFKVNWLFSPSKGISYADPFPFKWDGDIYILFECLNFNKGKGEICSLIFNPSKKRNNDFKVCMTMTSHISYPFIFNYKNDIYLIPESCRANEVALYKSTKFPFAWEKKAVILENIEAADPTIFHHNGFWWLTCTIGRERWNHELSIFFSKDIFGPWYPHKNNPVKIDIRSSRPAGRVFNHDNLLIRPSQDCSKAYGKRIVLNKINKLTPYDFEEEALKIIEPFKGSDYEQGVHTINAIDDITIVDGRRDIFSLKKFLNRKSKKK